MWARAADVIELFDGPDADNPITTKPITTLSGCQEEYREFLRWQNRPF